MAVEETKQVDTRNDDDLQYKRQEGEKGSIIETFDSISEFFRVCDKREVNDWCGSPARNKHDSWHGGCTYKELKDNIQYGLQVDVAKFKEKVLEEAQVQGWNKGNSGRMKLDVYGSVPVVPNAIMGLPKTMKHRDEKPKKGKIVNIIYDTSVNAGISAKEQERYGARVVALINQLESAGYRVRLDVLDNFCSSDVIYACRVKVKSEDKPGNLKKLAALLTNVGWQRMAVFDWYERLPGAKCLSGYGRPLMNSGRLQEEFRDKFLGRGDYYICYGKDLKEVFRDQLNMDEVARDDR